MGDGKFTCPLCCGGTFNSRQSLVDHLEGYTQNFRCLICQQKFHSLDDLAIHLRGQCDFNDTRDNNSQNMSSLKIEVSSGNQNILVINGTSMTDNVNDNQDNEIDETDSDEGRKNIVEEASVDNEGIVDIELTRKHSEALEDSMVTCLESEQLKLIDENGESKYVLLDNDGTSTLISDSTIITKQNSDGTISLLSIKNEQKPSDESSSASKKEIEIDSTEEFYNCTSCGVNFTSVLEHIQAYHSNQEVVLEMNGSDGRTEDVTDDETITLEFPSEISDKNSQSDSIRRVITESGDIVTNYADVEISEEEFLKNNPSHTLIEQEVVDEIGQVYTRKLVRIDKFWGNATLEEKQEFNEPVPVKEAMKTVQHQAVIKKVKLADGSWSSEMYNCVKCNAFTSTLEEFNKHVCELKYPCPHCPVAYSNSKSLCAHMKVHKTAKQVALKATLQSANGTHKAGANQSPNGPFRCEVCYTIFPTNKSLRLHRRMHDPIKARPLEPPVEQGRCNNMDPTETFHCLQCDKWIPVGYKKVHLNYHRSSHTTYNCGICNRKFNSDDFLAMHMKIHNIDKGNSVKQEKSLPYSCLYCSRQFARPHEKVKHERIHTGEKPHACEICGKSFRVSYCLTLHMRTHTGMRPYACPHCGKRFKAHSVYNHHLLTHSEVRAYKCPYCPKAFKTSVQLAGHKNSHTKPYSCTHCNRPFASLYAVRVHTDSHRRTNNLKFSCSLCGASYARTFALKDHMKQAHQSEIDADDNNDPAEKDWNVPSLEGIITNDMQSEMKEITMNSNTTDSEIVIGLVPSIEKKS